MKRLVWLAVAVAVIVVIVVGVYAGIVLSAPHTNSTSVVNIGYYYNVNHAPALLGIYTGAFQSALGPSTKIVSHIFTSGGPEMLALLAGQIDIAYVGPDPAVNAYLTSLQSNGTGGLVVLAGVSSGGAVFVVQNNSGIQPYPEGVSELGGKTFAAPGVGNTQDIALRYFLSEYGYNSTTQGGNVTVEDTSNANIVTLFAKGEIAGAWVPEPYGEVLIQQYGGKLFLDERSLWPEGQFSTTELVVRTSFLQQHPDVVKDIVSADVQENNWINAHPSQAQVELNDSLVNATGSGYSSAILNASFNRLSFTYDPLESSVLTQAQHAYDVGDLTQDPTNLTGLFDLSVLNSVLSADGLPAVQS